LLRAWPVIDAHCDTLLKVSQAGRGHFSTGLPGTHVDLPRLEEAGVTAQFFACYVEPQYLPHRALERALELVDHFYGEVEYAAGRLLPVTGHAGVLEAYGEGKVAGILSIEGGEVLQGDLAVLRALHRLGVRSLTLTWNFRNALADGVAEARTGGGLTRFGVEVVREMGRLGMLVDVSHLSEAGFWHVLEEAPGAVVASHSNARSVCDHPRNLTDDQIRALAAKGGVMGLNLCPALLTREADKVGPDGRSVGATLADALDHVDHVVSLVGPEHLGLGMDYDGIVHTPVGLEDVSKLPFLVSGMLERGHSPEIVRGILGGNLLGVMREVGMA